MAKLVPLRFDDNTIIYIETTESATGAIAASVVQPKPNAGDEEEIPVTRGLPTASEAQRQAAQSFQAIESTIRAYTTYSLNAFKNLAVAHVNKVTLSFGIEIGGEAGVPYITKGTAKSNLNITVECSFPYSNTHES